VEDGEGGDGRETGGVVVVSGDGVYLWVRGKV
jgi:hypothetical protein